MDADWQGLGTTLSDLVSPDRWQRLQDHFSEVLGIGLRTLAGDKTLLANPSWPSWLDVQKITSLFRLGDELEDLLPAGSLPQDTITITRPSGISFSVCPLRANAKQVIAYLVVGPVVLGRREDPDQFSQRVSALGLDPNVLWPFLLTIRLYSFSSMKSVLRLLEDVGNTLLQSAFQSRATQAVAPEAPKIDRALASHYLDRLAHSLLDAAVAATQADGGSVMLFDPSQTAMQIRAAHGLSRDVVEKARVRSGESFAGMAAAQRAILLIDERNADEQVKRLMRRTELTSSLVAPILTEASGRPLGVLNLRTSHPQRRFTLEHIEIVRRLMNLAGLAASSLQVAFGQGPTATSPDAA